MNVTASTYDIAFTVTNAISAIVCAIAVILVFALKLHKKVVYRLSLYLVLSSLVFAVVEALQIVSVYRDYVPHYQNVCKAIGWFNMYARWTKLLFTAWVTFHLFCFAVLHKNMKKLEALYVSTSLSVSALIASIPMIFRWYRDYADQKNNFYCFVFSTASNGTYRTSLSVPMIIMWDVPAMALLLAVSVATTLILMKLSTKACMKKQYLLLPDGGQFGKALKQLLPLSAFPVLFFAFMVPVLVLDVYLLYSPKPHELIFLFTAVFIGLWSTTSGVSLMVHICIATHCLPRTLHAARRRYSRFHPGLNVQPYTIS